MRSIIAFGLAGALLQAPVAGNGAAVSGQVLENSSRTPIAGAEVRLIRLGRERRTAPQFDGPLVTLADRDGRYVFQNVEPGQYQIDARKAGFALVVERIARLALAAGEQRAGVEVLLLRGAVIAGRVIDENGEPLADARVYSSTRWGSR